MFGCCEKLLYHPENANPRNGVLFLTLNNHLMECESKPVLAKFLSSSHQHRDERDTKDKAKLAYMSCINKKT